MARGNSDSGFEHADLGEMTPEQYAQWLEENESDDAWGEPVAADISPNLSSVVSVRFNKGELALVNAAADKAGLKLSTFIRQLVIDNVSSPDAETQLFVRTLMQDREAIEAAAETLTSVVRHLRAVPSQDVGSGTTPGEHRAA